jgi:hypothetical protein
MDSELSLLARQAAECLVSAAGEPEWQAVGFRFVEVFAHQGRPAVDRFSALARAVEGTAPESRDETRAELLPGWVARLRLWLADEPDTAPRLRELVEACSGSRGNRITGDVNIVVQQSATAYTILGGSLNISLHGVVRDTPTTD